MGTRTLDCVEMKHRIQARLVAEHERRKDEFPSCMAFIRATTAEYGGVQGVRARRAGGQGEMSNVKT